MSHPHGKGGRAPASAREDDVTYAYTRRNAIGDGVLVDVTAWANSAGFDLPVAVTQRLWNRFIVPTEALREDGGDDKQRRVSHILTLLQGATGRRRVAGQPGDRVAFRVDFRLPPDRTVTARLHAVCGPGDDGEAVLTIMLDGED